MRQISLVEFEESLCAAYADLEINFGYPPDAIDEWVCVLAAELIAELVHQSLILNPPFVVRSRSMMPTTDGMRVVAKMLDWVRERMLSESPYLNVAQATRYLGLNSEKQIYGAVERGKLKGTKFGKELKFTRNALDEVVR